MFKSSLRFGAALALSFVFVSGARAQSDNVSLSSEKPKQGEVVQVTVRSESEPDPVEFNGERYRFFEKKDESGVYNALLTIPVVMRPGVKKLTAGGETRQITVTDAKFYTQKLSLPPGKNNFNMAPGEEAAVDGAKATLSGERQWKGNFTPPSQARISSAFGNRRIVNGVLLDDYFHSGLDYAGFTGSPVKAVAPGKVILAVSQGFKLHGNTIAIDHGQGVVSFYIHLSKVHVKKGESVKQGQLIGAIGQTGRANGPHLHFSIYCNKNASNPWQWYRKAF